MSVTVHPELLHPGYEHRERVSKCWNVPDCVRPRPALCLLAGEIDAVCYAGEAARIRERTIGPLPACVGEREQMRSQIAAVDRRHSEDQAVADRVLYQL